MACAFQDLKGAHFSAVLVKFGFDWDFYRKWDTTMMFGPSPEVELALFTLCFKVRPGRQCQVNLSGYNFTIRTELDGGKSLLTAHYSLGAKHR